MSDEKQLTVAELLARAGKNSGSDEQATPRRRRRNLEDGGVSVAELTGSIPKVDTKPAESRHSSVPLDEDSAATGGAPEAEAPAAKEPAAKAAKDAPATGGKETPPKGKQPDPDHKPGKPGAKSKASAAAKPKAADNAQAAAVTGAGPEKPATAKPDSEAEEAAPLKPTPAATGDRSAAAEPDQPVPSKEDTAVIGAIEAEEPPRKDPAGQVPDGMAGNVAAAAAVPAGVATGAGLLRNAPAADGADTTGELAVVSDDAPAGASAAATDEDVDTADPSDDEGISVVAMLGLAVVGIIIGVVVFLLFDQLWTRFPNIPVGIAAVVVTALMVAGTRMLRTVNDGLSMSLAAVAGLLMTFGPALIIAF